MVVAEPRKNRGVGRKNWNVVVEGVTAVEGTSEPQRKRQTKPPATNQRECHVGAERENRQTHNSKAAGKPRARTYRCKGGSSNDNVANAGTVYVQQNQSFNIELRTVVVKGGEELLQVRCVGIGNAGVGGNGA